MQRAYFFIFALCFFSVFATPVSAQPQVVDAQFEHLSVKQGLSQSTVVDIAEDSQGFIWFATTDGLNRYDGYEFVQYHHDSKDPESLPAQLIRQLFVDSSGRLWVGSSNGLAIYRPESDDFEVFNRKNSALESDEIWHITEDHQGRILISDQSRLYQFQQDSHRLIAVEMSGAPIPPEIKTVLAEPQKSWIGSYGHGIYILENATNTLFSLAQENPWGLNFDARFLFDIKRINGDYWLATENGVFVIDKDYEIKHHFHQSSYPALLGNEVRGIEKDEKGNIWLASSDGLNILSPDNLQVTAIEQSQGTGESQKWFILNLFKDSKNNMWLASFADGAYRYNQKLSGFQHYKVMANSPYSLSDNMVWAFAEDNNGYIWIATQSGGINRLDTDTGEISHFLQDQKLTIWGLKIDLEGKLWANTANGLYVYQIQNGQLYLIRHLLPGQPIEHMTLSAGFLWLSQNNQVVAISTDDFTPRSYAAPSDSILGIRPLLVDSEGNLWISSQQGVMLMNPVNGDFTPLNVKAIANNVVEGTNYFWLSTYNNGLIKLDKKTYKPASIHPADMELPKSVYTLLKQNEHLWVITSSSISHLNMNDNTVVRKISSNSFNYNELNEDSGIVTQEGLVILGGTKGFHIIDPSSFSTSQQAPSVAPALTGLSILNSKVNHNLRPDVLSHPINRSDSITLANKDFPFTLTFAHINPLNPDTVHFRYRLNGLSGKWLDANNKIRQATFSQLGFGNYQFEVQSSVETGIWSPSKTLNIYVLPPVWLQPTALVSYLALSILIFLYLFRQLQLRRKVQRKVRDNEERLKLTLWGSGDELWDWNISDNTLHRVNEWKNMEFPQDDSRAPALQSGSNIHREDIQRVRLALDEHLQQDSEYFEATYRVQNMKGKWLWVLDRGKVVEFSDNNQPLRMTGTLKNISHLKQAEEQLKLFKRSIETISDGVFITNKNFQIISVNQAYCHITGESKDKALNSNLSFSKYPAAFNDEIRKTLQQRGTWSGEIESVRVNGEPYVVELVLDAIQGEDQRVSHYVGVFADITSRKSTEKELLKLANSDTLTGLPNRSFFQASHQNLVRKGIKHVLLCLDMDNFKKINDSLGHETGDSLIKVIARRLQKAIGTHATCYRLGGDEFSFLLEKDTDVHKVTHLAKTILQEMQRSFTINKQEFVLGASIGIAFFPEDGNSPQELLKNADTAMYHAKNEGGNQYQFFSNEMNQNAVRQLQIENLIRHGLKEDLFTLFYQPKVDISTGKLVSMEALVRFEHPQKGVVSPGQFIPLAEETGQIIELGERILTKACQDTKRWVDAGLFAGRVAINFSAKQFELPDLDQRIQSVLQETGLSPLHLECEITESALMQQPEQALALMQRLRSMGLHLALDDFGTGYSSLAYLKRFPLNTLKIDKAFIDDIVTSEPDRQMASSIITIAHNLGLHVVAEGVEEEAQLNILRKFNCEMLQGYLYSKPLSASRFENLLVENQKLNKLMTDNINNR